MNFSLTGLRWSSTKGRSTSHFYTLPNASALYLWFGVLAGRLCARNTSLMHGVLSYWVLAPSLVHGLNAVVHVLLCNALPPICCTASFILCETLSRSTFVLSSLPVRHRGR